MNIIQAAISVFAYVLNILLLVRCIVSWVSAGGDNPLIRLIYALTDPLVMPIRSLIERSSLGGRGGMMIDFSPMIAMLLINAISRLLISAL